MARFSLCGGTYQSQSPVADAEWTMNLIPEVIESEGGKSRMAMYPSPGLTAFCTGLGSVLRGEREINGRFFCVVDTTLWEISSGGVSTNRGTVANDSLPVSMASSQTQLFFISAGTAYVFNLQSLVLSAVTALNSGLSWNIASPGGALVTTTAPSITAISEVGNVCTVTINQSFQTAGVTPEVGSAVVIAGVGVAGYNGTFSIATIVDSTHFTYVNGTTGLGASSGGTAQAGVVSFVTTSANIFAVNDTAVVAGVTNASYNGTYTVAKVVGINVQVVCYITDASQFALAQSGGGTITRAQSKPYIAEYCDGYFICLYSNSQFWQISAINDATTWDAVSISGVSIFPDNLVSIIVDHREVWLLGRTKSVAYYDTGAASPSFPFSPIQGAYIEQGCAAAFSPVRIDNSLMWLGQDDRGWMMAWRANGYTPVRISNNAIENTWNGYGTVSDAIGFSYQEEGHTFYVVSFPTANATWAYDVSTGLWEQRGEYVSGPSGATWTFNAHKAQFHAFCFGKHLVGNLSEGTVYQQSISLNDDNGSAKQWVRRSPVLSVEDEWLQHSKLQIIMEPGLDNVSIVLRWSDDYGKTWSSSHTLSTGAIGAYSQRVIARRLGRSRHRIYEISGSGIAKIIDAYVEASPGYSSPTQRLSERLSQSA